MIRFSKIIIIIIYYYCYFEFFMIHSFKIVNKEVRENKTDVNNALLFRKDEKMNTTESGNKTKELLLNFYERENFIGNYEDDQNVTEKYYDYDILLRNTKIKIGNYSDNSKLNTTKLDFSTGNFFLFGNDENKHENYSNEHKLHKENTTQHLNESFENVFLENKTLKNIQGVLFQNYTITKTYNTTAEIGNLFIDRYKTVNSDNKTGHREKTLKYGSNINRTNFENVVINSDDVIMKPKSNIPKNQSIFETSNLEEVKGIVYNINEITNPEKNNSDFLFLKGKTVFFDGYEKLNGTNNHGLRNNNYTNKILKELKSNYNRNDTKPKTINPFHEEHNKTVKVSVTDVFKTSGKRGEIGAEKSNEFNQITVENNLYKIGTNSTTNYNKEIISRVKKKYNTNHNNKDNNTLKTKKFGSLNLDPKNDMVFSYNFSNNSTVDDNDYFEYLNDEIDIDDVDLNNTINDLSEKLLQDRLIDGNITIYRNLTHNDFKLLNILSSSKLSSYSLTLQADQPPWPVKMAAETPGDLIVGGLMMVHEREESITCGPIMPQGGVQALEAMLYTLDVLNGRSDRKFKLGAHILDDCDKDTYGLEMAVDFIKERTKGNKVLNSIHHVNENKSSVEIDNSHKIQTTLGNNWYKNGIKVKFRHDKSKLKDEIFHFNKNTHRYFETDKQRKPLTIKDNDETFRHKFGDHILGKTDLDISLDALLYKKANNRIDFHDWSNDRSDFIGGRMAFVDDSGKHGGQMYNMMTLVEDKFISGGGSDKPVWPVKREATLEGDLIIGGLMMVHEREESITCGPIMPQGGVQALEAMLYTLDVLNSRSDAKFKLGAHILDDCDKDTYGLEMAVDFIKERTKGNKVLNSIHHVNENKSSVEIDNSHKIQTTLGNNWYKNEIKVKFRHDKSKLKDEIFHFNKNTHRYFETDKQRKPLTIKDNDETFRHKFGDHILGKTDLDISLDALLYKKANNRIDIHDWSNDRSDFIGGRMAFVDDSGKHGGQMYNMMTLVEDKFISGGGSDKPVWPVKREATLEGDLIIGGLMMVHEREESITCGPIMPQGGVQALEAMLYTLDVLNSRSDAKFKLGAHILDDCDKDTYGLEMAVDFIKGSISNIDDSESHCNKTQVRKVISGVVGAASSVTSIQVANLLRLFKIPQVSFMSTSPELSNKQRFEYFTRTIPSDHHQVQAMVEIVRRLRWSYVSIVYEESNYGIKAFEELEVLLSKYNICIAVKEKLVKDSGVAEETAYDNIVLKLQTKPRARGAIIYGSDQEVAGFMRAVRRCNATGSFSWIGSDGWSARSLVFQGSEPEVEGTLSVQPQANPVRGFDNYFLNLTVENNKRNPWFVEFWEDHFQCRYPNSSKTPYNIKYTNVCTTKERLTRENTAFENQLQFVSDAVMALAVALNDMHRDYCGGQPGLCDKMKPTQGSDLLKYLRKVTFTGLSGDKFRFDQNGDGPARYNIINFKQVTPGTYHWINVGEYIDGELRLDIPAIQFKLGQASTPESVCSLPCEVGQAKTYVEGESCCWHCFNCSQYQIRHPSDETMCIMCPEGTIPDSTKQTCLALPENYLRVESGWAIGAMSLSAIGILVTMFVVGVFFRHNETPVVKASGRELSYVLLTGLLLCYLVTFVFVLRPTDVVCGVQRFGAGFCFTVVYAALLTKTNRISRIFNASKHTAKRPNFITPKSQLIICSVLVSVQLLINAVWMIVSPPRAIHHYPTRDDNMLICSSYVDASYMIAFGYPIILIIICTVYAVLTRNIPEAFNESKHIGFTMYTTCVIWLAFVPLYFGTGSHMPLRITSMAVTISLSASVTVACLFSPKLYIILIRPERNVRQSMMPNSRHGGTMKTSTAASIMVGAAPLSSRPQSLTNKDPSHDTVGSKENHNTTTKEKLLISRSTQTLSTLCCDDKLETKIEINENVSENKTPQNQPQEVQTKCSTTVLNIKNNNSSVQPTSQNEQLTRPPIAETSASDSNVTTPISTIASVTPTFTTTVLPTSSSTTRQNSTRSINTLQNVNKTAVCSVTNSAQSSTIVGNGPAVVGESESV